MQAQALAASDSWTPRWDEDESVRVYSALSARYLCPAELHKTFSVHVLRDQQQLWAAEEMTETRGGKEAPSSAPQEHEEEEEEARRLSIQRICCLSQVDLLFRLRLL